MVKAIGSYLLVNVDEISQLLSLEAGKQLWEAVMEIEGAARYFELSLIHISEPTRPY